MCVFFSEGSCVKLAGPREMSSIMVTMATGFQDGTLLVPLECRSSWSTEQPVCLSLCMSVCVCLQATQALVEASYLKIDTSSVSGEI